MSENLPGVEALIRWNFPDLPESSRIFSEMRDGVVLVTVYYRETPESQKNRIDLALELHLFSHVKATEPVNDMAYREFLANRNEYELSEYI